MHGARKHNASCPISQTSKLDLIWRWDVKWCAEKNKAKETPQKSLKLGPTEKASYSYALRSSSTAVVQRLLWNTLHIGLPQKKITGKEASKERFSNGHKRQKYITTASTHITKRSLMKLPGRVLDIVQDIIKLAKHTAIVWVNIKNTEDPHTALPPPNLSKLVGLSVLIITFIT